MTVRTLVPGEAAPWFHAKALDGNPRFAFHTTAGRPIVLLLLGSGAHPATAAALDVLARHRALFDDRQAAFFGVSVDPEDVTQRRIAQQVPGIRWFIDDDRAVSRAYHAIDDDGGQDGYRPHWLLLDRSLRVVSGFAIDRGDDAMASLRALIAAADDESATAPVLIVPRVFEPGFCRSLIDAYEQHGGEDSGFMRDVNGVTVEQFDHSHKRRSDHLLNDADLDAAVRARFSRLLIPAIKRAFQFEVTRVERMLVACYDSADGGGHFRPHRDNTTNGTAHRRFACTINLNVGEYEGGDLRFPEFGPRTYRAPTGGAAVFSCSLLHEAMPVTQGRRYAFLPFFYDEAAARLREANLPNVAPELQSYRA